MLPAPLIHTARRTGIPLSRAILVASVLEQTMWLFEQTPAARRQFLPRQRFRISTSRFGVGQENGSNQTPLGLHRIAEKIGAGHPIGTVFRGRKPVGFTWNGCADALIAHRILWLEGLESGKNRGANVDSHSRYIYIHGTGNELALGRPASSGCIHLSAADLLPLFDRVHPGTLVWIQNEPC